MAREIIGISVCSSLLSPNAHVSRVRRHHVDRPSKFTPSLATHCIPRSQLLEQAGNQVGENFWKTVLKEHGLGNDGVRCSLRYAIERVFGVRLMLYPSIVVHRERSTTDPAST